LIWPYHSHRDLADAGYCRRDQVPCLLCGSPIVIYSRPYEFPVFLDPGSFALHLEGIQHVYPPSVPQVDGKSAASGEHR
jgi:hypothetical protein